MTQSTKKYTLSKMRQLVDLNEDSVNFDLTFKVSSLDNKPFYVVVVDQTTLDNSDELNYNEAKKSISGNILADKNVYQNYFLIMKADEECNVEVELIKRDLPQNDNISPQDMSNPQNNLLNNSHNTAQQGMNSHAMNSQAMNSQAMNSQAMNSQAMNSANKLNSPNQSSGINWQYIAIAAIIVVGSILLWYFYSKNKSKTGEKSESLQQAVNKSPDPHTFKPDMKFSSQLNTNYGKKSNSSRSVSSVSSSSEITNRITHRFPSKFSKNKR